MKASIDESVPEIRGGIAYVVAAALVIAPVDDAREALRKVIAGPDRKRPFHWHAEGSEAKARMVDCLADLGAVAHIAVHHPTGRKKTEAARQQCLHAIVPLAVRDGAEELIIESRDKISDRRDRKVVLDLLRELAAPGAISYSHAPKTEPLLWPADAVCGAVRAFLIGDDTRYYEQLRHIGVISEPIYLNENAKTNALNA